MRLSAVVAVVCLAASRIVVADSVAWERKATNIPAQDLGAALQTLAKDREFEIVYVFDEVSALRTQGVQGTLTVQEALTQLLNGTGLKFKFLGDNAVSIVSSSVSTARLLREGSPATATYQNEDPSRILRLAADSSVGSFESAAHSGRVRLAQNDTASSAPATTEPARDTIDEVIVTARRREENIQSVPVAVSVVSGAAFTQMNINDSDGLNKLPSVQVNTAGERRFQLALRGLGTSFGSQQDSVIQYFAEVPSFEVGYFDLENVQVIKGPQGTLFGETAVGGVVLYSPRKPTSELEGYVTLEGGDYEYRKVEGAVGGALIPDKLTARAAFQYRKRDGYIKNYFSTGADPADMANEDNLFWRLSLTWTPLENVENYTVYAGSVLKNDGIGSPLRYFDPRFMPAAVRNLPPSLPLIPALAAGFEFWSGYAPPPGMTYGQLVQQALARQLDAGAFKSFSNFPQNNESQFHGIINQTRWDVSDALTLRNIFSMYWTRSKGPAYDIDGTDLPVLDTRDWYARGTTDPASGDWAWTGGYPSRTYTEEVQALGKLFDDRLNWQVGFYYREKGSRDFSESGLPFVAVGSVSNTLPAATCARLGVAAPCTGLQRSLSKSMAGYAQGTYQLLDNLNLTLGYRHTRDYNQSQLTATAPYSVTFNGVPMLVPVGGRPPIEGAGVETSVLPWHSEDNYNITFDYKLREEVLLYAAHRKGYKGGGINSNFQKGDPLHTFGPETIKDVEVGAKTAWTLGGMNGTANIALFESKYSDIQRTQSIPGQLEIYTTNLAEAKIKGIEFDVSLAPTTWFQIRGDFTYLDAKYTDWTENKPCGQITQLPQCAALPPTTTAVIDHANGSLTLNGETIRFEPDRFGDAPKYSWGIHPALLLQEFLEEDVIVSGSIYHRSSFVSGVAAANTSLFAGITPLSQDTIFGESSEPLINPGFTRADVRVDWKHVFDSPTSLYFGVTNVTDKKYDRTSQAAFAVFGLVYATVAEPRMWQLGLTYEFGQQSR
ncbi:MAG: TonB-dependent receptor plug domain-containing protein [Steroidobacteraceae bacterium]